MNLELVERVQPLLALISSVGGGGKYEFPHPLAVDATRDALRTARGPGRGELADHELGIHYTAAVTRRAGEAEPRPLGSIALMVPAKRGAKLRMWRFGDDRRAPVDLDRAWLMDYARPARRKAPT